MKYCLVWICLSFLLVQGFKFPSVTQLNDPVDHGESPVWNGTAGKLLYVNKGQILAYDYNTETTEVICEYPGNDITPLILTKNYPNVLIAGIDRTLSKISLNDTCSEPLALYTVQNDKPKNRINCGKADSRGRVWIGTQGYKWPNGTLDRKAGALFRFTKGNLTHPTVMIPAVSESNGLAWNHDDTKFYFIDSVSGHIAKYDYDAETGNIANGEVVCNFTDVGIGSSSGMTTDEDKNLWIALWGGGSVIQVNSTTCSILKRVPIPAAYVTSVAWGGPNLDILFVTTSRINLTPKEQEQQPGAGSLYGVTNLGTKGLPGFEADII